MSIDLADYDKLAKKAIRSFWKTRTKAKQTQKAAGKSDQGERASVTSGRNLDGFLKLIDAVVKANGLKNADIHLERRTLTLPGYFRPTKLWDMLIMNQGRLVAIVELKSQLAHRLGTTVITAQRRRSVARMIYGLHTEKVHLGNNQNHSLAG